MSSDAPVSAGATAEGREPGVPESAWSTLPWYKTGLGLGVIAFDVVLTIGLAVGTTGVFDSIISSFVPDTVGVPLGIYAFCLLGALGYVFTTLVERFDSETDRILQYNLRLPAALPLGAGIYVLSEIILGTAASPGLVYGLAFLSGLYVNLAYKRLGALARRLLPKKQTGDSNSKQSSTDTQNGAPTTSETTSSKPAAEPGDTSGRTTEDTSGTREPVTVSRATPNDDSPSTAATSSSSKRDEPNTPADSPNTSQ